MEAYLTDEPSRGLLLDRPQAVADELPHARITQHPDPALLSRARPAADEARHDGIGPQRDIVVEIVEPVRPENRALGFDRRYCRHGAHALSRARSVVGDAASQ